MPELVLDVSQALVVDADVTQHRKTQRLLNDASVVAATESFALAFSVQRWTAVLDVDLKFMPG